MSEKKKQRSHNWQDLKFKYFLSDEFVIETFLKKVGVVKEGQRQFDGKKTKGWRDEKTKWIEEQNRKALELANKKIEVTNSDLIKAKAKALDKVIQYLDVGTVSSFSVAAFAKILDIVKRELGEPLIITENNNNNTNPEAPPLTKKEKEAFNKKFKKMGFKV